MRALPSKPSRRAARLAMLLAMPALLAVGPAAAGAQADSTARDSVRRAAARRDSAARTLAPVTVVATRVPRLALDVPLAVTVVDREQLATRRGYGLEDALATVPGVWAQSRSGTSDVRITIRGFGARGAGDRSNAGTSRGIRVLTDGVPETEPDGRTSFDLVELAAVERVDVVRSNASAAWGNAAGGVVNVITMPTFGERLLEAQQAAGSFGYRRSVLRAGTALGAAGTARVHGSFVNTGYAGWREGSDARRATMALGVAAPLGERTSLAVQATGTNNLFHIPGPLTRAQAEADPRQANATYRARDERRWNRVGRVAVTLDHARSEARGLTTMLFVNPKLLQRSERGTYRDFTRHHFGGSAVWRGTTRLSASTTNALLVGADGAFQDGAVLFYSLTPQGTRGAELRDNKREGARNAGAFVQDELALGATLLTVGARLDDIAYFNESYVDPDMRGSRSFRRVTPKLGLVRRLGATHRLYASVGGGVEAPAGNETDPASTFGQDTVHAINPLLEPIRSTTYELGTKGAAHLGEGMLRELSYDVAGYRTDVRNEIVPYRGGRFYFTAGHARRAGAELGAALRAAGGVSLRTAVTWSRNRYVTYRVDSVHYDPALAGHYADYAGREVVGVPPLFFGATLGVAPAAWRGLGLELRAQGASRYYADDANRVVVPGFAEVDATVSLGAPLPVGGGTGVRGFVGVTNVFDRRYMASAFLNPDVVGGVPVAFEPAMPRSVVAALSLVRVR